MIYSKSINQEKVLSNAIYGQIPKLLRIAQAAMLNPQSNATEEAKRFNLTRTTLYDYLNGNGSLKEAEKNC